MAAHAQNGNIFDVFRGLFGGAPPPKPEQDKPKKPRKPRVSQPLVNHPPGTANQTNVERPTIPPSFFVHVLGDSLGTMVAQGLTESLADKPEIAVIKRAKDASGFVRDDFFDWQKASTDLVNSTEKVDIAVLMIGSNDHQPFLKDGKLVAEMGSDEWVRLYRSRVEAEAKIFQDKQIKLIWVGLPIMRGDSYSNEMSKLNEIYRDIATTHNAVFIDTWDVFADEKGQYDANGPDINGQQARLRTSDGIHFTKAGQRKLASFVERDIRRTFDERSKPAPDQMVPQQTQQAPLDSDAKPADVIAVKKERPVSGPAISLSAPPMTASGELVTTLRQRPAISRLIIGNPEDQHPGRADDFNWPPQ
eukprot:gene7327-7394_t